MRVGRVVAGTAALCLALVAPVAVHAQAKKANAAPKAQAAPTGARSPYQAGEAWLQANADTLRAVNRRIWSNPEVGLAETRAANELITLLERAGFKIERNVAGMPTAFVASAGSGRPIIGIMAEYDALPGTSQAAVPERRKRESAPDNDAGHACGHSLFGVGSTAAAIAAWDAARAARLPGTIRLYGTPAEETGIGKVYMTRAGVFDDLDAVLHWHASDRNQVSYATSKCVISVKFRFDGISAHASMSPQFGRSALDAVELMNVGTNFLREHLDEDARIHYVVTDGGGQPNVVPPTAEVWYYLRTDFHENGEKLLARVRDIAKGAALMTSTEVSDHVDSDTFEMLPNRPLSELLQRQMERVGAPRFDERERAFAQKTQADLTNAPSEPLATRVLALPETPWHMRASTDVGNVSWTVPTGGINVACYTSGAPGHSWQIVACSGMSIGEKGMMVAARALAGSTLELLSSPAVLAAARRDFETRRSRLKAPVSVIPDGQVPPVAIR